MERERHRAILMLDPDAILHLLKDSNDGCRLSITERGLPDDVHFVGTFQDIQRQAFSVVVESETFEDIEPCMMLPVLDDPVIATISHPTLLETCLGKLLIELGVYDGDPQAFLSGDWEAAVDQAIQKIRVERAEKKHG